MKKTWKMILPEIKARVQGKQRLTLRQGTLLLAEYERLVLFAEDLQHVIRDLQLQHEADTDYLNKRIMEWNTMMEVLKRVLNADVYGEIVDSNLDSNLAWVAHYDGQKSNPVATVAAAYEIILKERLKQSKG